VDAHERRAPFREPLTNRELRLGKCDTEARGAAITSPVDFISGPRIVSTPGKRTNGNTGLFTKTPATCRSSVNPSSASVRPAITLAAIFASDTPAALDR